MKKVHYFKLLVLIVIIVSCDNKKSISIEKEKAALLKLHNAQRTYHFNKNADAFVNQFSSNFISVNKGKIETPTKAESIKRFSGYFSSVEFKQWDDVSEPIIRISDDATMAYVIVDKIVAVTYKDNEGKLTEGETHFAWTTIYRKYGNEWQVDCVTSTNKPIK